MGAWIETAMMSEEPYQYKSHPMWVRGLKHIVNLSINKLILVAPYVGAWIETLYTLENIMASNVAPYVGAWIETLVCVASAAERCVAPYVGAWIETFCNERECVDYFSRTLCGCVD